MTVTWRKQYPKDSTIIRDLPILHSDNFNVVMSAAEYEHYSMASGETLSGYHRPGAVGLVYEGTAVQIAALTGMVAGALARATDLGAFFYYTGSAWVGLSESKWSRMRAYLNTGSEMAVTSGAAAATIVFNKADYDTMSEMNTATGIFTALASGYYLINANACFVASGSQTISGVTYPAANAISTQFTPSAAANWDNVEEAAANDADNNLSKTTGHVDLLSGTTAITDVPASATDIAVQVNWRAKKAGCVCNNECYSQTCPCDATCYQHSCSCNNTCYGYTSCSCNNTCYVYTGKGCSCNLLCYGYTACSCNNTCYGQTCTCNTGYGYGTGCGCYNVVYGDEAITMNSALYIGSTRYDGDVVVPEDAFTNYTDIWDVNPSTGLDWTAAGVSAISAFGYRMASVSAGNSTLTGWVSQTNLQTQWYPIRPTLKLHIYKNGALAETSITPIYESKGAATNQTASIGSIIWLVPTDQVDIRVQKTLYNDVISAGSSLTNLSIHRLAGPLG